MYINDDPDRSNPYAAAMAAKANQPIKKPPVKKWEEDSVSCDSSDDNCIIIAPNALKNNNEVKLNKQATLKKMPSQRENQLKKIINTFDFDQKKDSSKVDKNQDNKDSNIKKEDSN